MNTTYWTGCASNSDGSFENDTRRQIAVLERADDMTLSYAGISCDEAVAARHRQKQKAQEQARGEMAVEGTETIRGIVAANPPSGASKYGEPEAGSMVGEGVKRPRRSDAMRAKQFIPSASLMNRKLVLNLAGEHRQRGEALCGPPAVACDLCRVTRQRSCSIHLRRGLEGR
jgi:hypothetical protein